MQFCRFSCSVAMSLLVSLLATSLQAAQLTDTEIAQLIREGAEVLDTRDDLSREIYGYLENSTRAEEVSHSNATESEQGATEGKVFLVDKQEVWDEICVPDIVTCYNGSLDIFDEFLVYPQNVTFEGLHVMIKEKRIVLIDIRNSTEFEILGKIPSSHNIPINKIPQAFLLPDHVFEEKFGIARPGKEDKNVVLTCRSGVSVYWAKARLEKIGYNKLRIYNGSFNEWSKRGGEIIPVSRTDVKTLEDVDDTKLNAEEQVSLKKWQQETAAAASASEEGSAVTEAVTEAVAEEADE